MAVALYLVLGYMSGPTPAVHAERRGRRPALDPAMLKAILLIFVELMLVTAIALFFSTFSTPILSAALTFGLFVAGQFSADLRNFEIVVDSPAAARHRAAGSTGCCRISAAVRRQGTGRPRPAGAARATWR